MAERNFDSVIDISSLCAAPRRFGVALVLLFTLPIANAVTLTVCVSADSAPQSYSQKGKVRGFDVRLAETLAAELGRDLKIVAFESEYEKESTLAHEVNALLSAGICDLASGFPLLQSDFGPPSRPSARTPDYPGAKRKRERPYIQLGELMPSRAYQANTLVVVLRPGERPVNTLLDLRERKIGAVSGTLGGTLITVYRNGILRPGMVSLSQREDAWRALESGRVDALLMPSAAFDAYKLEKPQSTFIRASYQRPIGVNFGWVALRPQSELLAAANRVIERTLADGSMQRWATEEGLSWHPPTQPDISAGITQQSLTTD